MPAQSKKPTAAPTILKKIVVAETNLFTIEALDLRFSNGVERTYERIKGRYKGSVLVIPYLDEDTILLIREYGVGSEGYALGFPKGAIELDEDVLKTANRELMEEVGYSAQELAVISKVSASPGYVSSGMYIVTAKHLTEKKLEGDEPEPLEVISWSLRDVDGLLAHPEFYEARSMAALLLIERQRHAEGRA